jgi:hypothetical protein
MTAATLASALALLSVAGCGDDGLGKRYPVSGKVTYKGEPVANASISFVASGENAEKRGATGVVKDGYYTLSTMGGDDGAFPGDYKVAITGREADLSQAKANADKVGGSFRQDDVAKAYKNAKSSIPKKYESPDVGLKAKVEAHSNTFDFPLSD